MPILDYLFTYGLNALTFFAFILNSNREVDTKKQLEVKFYCGEIEEKAVLTGSKS